MSAILKDTRIISLALLCLVLLNDGCESTTLNDLTVQPAHPPIVWPTVIDRGLLYGKPCNPPCWEGITPGISSKKDVVRIFDQLKSEGRIESYTLWNYRAEWPSGEMYVIFDGRYVGDMWINYNHLQGFDYRLRQVIERFGEPEAYALYSNFRRPESDSPCEDWDDSEVYAHPSTLGYFLYPSQGVTVLVAIAAGYTGCICPEMKITAFYYYQPRSLVDVLQEGRSPASGGLDLSSEVIVQWHGYGPGY